MTAFPSMAVVLSSALVPAAIFTMGLFVCRPASSVLQGASFVHALPDPPAWTYATCASSAHDPSGKQTFDAMHCACSVHFWHVRPRHIGVGPVHASCSFIVHCTHIIVAPRSHTSGATHCSSSVHVVGSS